MDPDKIKGDIQRPYNSPEGKKSPDKVDPEKFKKVMKVDESEETEKRKKRNLSKEEEEGADEEVQEEILSQSPVTSFSELMSDKEELGNVFDKQSGGIRRQTAPQEEAPFTAPPIESPSVEGVEPDLESAPSSITPSYSPPPSLPQEEGQPPPPTSTQESVPSEENRSLSPPSLPSSPSPSFFPEETGKPPPPPSSQTKESQPAQTDETSSSSKEPPIESGKKENEPKKKKKKEEDTSILASQPKRKNLERLKKKGPKKAISEVKVTANKLPSKKKDSDQTTQKLDKKQILAPKEKKQTLPSNTNEGSAKPPSKKHSLKKQENKKPLEEGALPEKSEDSEKKVAKESTLFKRFSPKEAREQKIIKNGEAIPELAVPSSTSSSGGEQDGAGQQGKKKKDEHPFIEANSLTAGTPLPSFDALLPPIVPSTETPAYSKLSPEVFELFEKMGGVMMIEKSKGVTTTTMNINMPGSVFNGTQVVLSQYSTARNAFNIQLIGNPESVKVFTQNIDALKASFKQANFNFETNILNPILSTTKRSPHLIRRKGGAGGKGGQGKKKKD